MTHGTRYLRFNCTACGQCCRDFRVPLTDSDVRRLVTALVSETVTSWIEWLSPQQVDMTGEPETFVVLPEGRRLLALRHRDGACILLNEQLCSVHPARPRSCQLYPWDIDLGRRGGVKRLQLLHDHPPCEATFDGYVAPQWLAEQKRWERAEVTEYVRVVTAWNRAAERRRRLGKPLHGADVYLARLLTSTRGIKAATMTTPSAV
jgi:Fe-S-cluster containining protein